MEAIIFFVLVAVIVGVGLKHRYHERELEHKERLAAIEKCVDLPVRQSSAPWTSRRYLLHGMIWLFAGLAATVAIIAIALTSNVPPTMEEKLHAVTMARGSGATPEETQMLLNEPAHAEPRIPIGLAFLGLIPSGVGLAYLIFYRIESRKLLS
jgi:hypothetical protein